MDKILIIRLSSLGDVLLAEPVVRALKNAFPRAGIDFLTKTQYAPLFRKHPCISDVIEIGRGDLTEIFRLRRKIRSEYDLVVDLHRNLRSRILTAGFGMPETLKVRKFTFRRRLIACCRINLMKNTAAVPERYLNALAPKQVQDDGKGLEFHPDETSKRKALDLMRKAGIREKEAIALAVGSKWFTKQWPAHRVISLIRLLPREKFILLGSKEDGKVASEIAATAPARSADFTGLTDIGTAAEILRACRALVANDSGLMHLGCAVKVPVVALFGSTVREFGFFPFRAKAVVLEKPLSCRPCTTKGRKHCRLGTLECLESIMPEEVIRALKGLGIKETDLPSACRQE